MATKRMFSKEIVGSDAFLDMPTSSQLLYFHLGMEADDDGFIGNPKKVSRFIGASDDDLKILLSKKFLILFESGVVVVKHHRINNNWDKHNCKRTMYMEEFSQLNIKENKAYTLDKSQGVPIQTENRLKTVFRIEENRREENTSETEVSQGKSISLVGRLDSDGIPLEAPTKPKSQAKYPNAKRVFALFGKYPKNWDINKTQLKSAENLVEEKGLEKIEKVIQFFLENKDDPFCPQISSPYDLDSKWRKLFEYKKRKENA